MKKNKIVNKSIYTTAYPSFTRRIGAYILDFILLLTLTAGLALLFSFIFKYDQTKSIVEEKYIEYGLKVLDSETNKYVVVSDKNLYEAAALAFNKDPIAYNAWSLMFKKTIWILSLSVGLALLVLELIVPLFLKNGRTVGKYVFKIALITTNDLKIKFKNLFIRFLIGKLTINYLVPILVLILIFFTGGGSLYLWLILLIIGLANIYTIFGTKRHQSVPDYIAMVFPCDFENQMFFDTIEELNAAKCEENRIKNNNKGL